MSTPRCYVHGEKEAAGTCTSCLKLICGACSVFDDGQEVCPSCLPARRRSRTLIRMGLMGAVVLLAGAGAAYVATRPPGPPPPAPRTDHGEHNKVIDGLIAHRLKEPCDRTAVIKLGEYLIKANDPRGALEMCTQFFTACGEYPRLLWVKYSAHTRLSEFDAAAKTAGELIASAPDDKDYWIWRGQAWEEKGARDLAIADFRQAIALQPRLKSIPLNLVTLLERTGRKCDAALTLESYLQVYPELRAQPKFQVRLADLTKSQDCSAFASSGGAVITRRPSDTAILTPATFNKTHKGMFIVDTGATYVTLSSAFAAKLGLNPPETSRVSMLTAGGIRTVRLASVEQIDVQGARAGMVEVAIADDLPGIDGLLGLSFLSRFEVRFAAEQVELKTIKPK